ncbi:hypothetical protein [Cyanothece sp. BG0011]|nr:hypothetical protein [Cyanothece sp. BG0011]
MKRADRKIPSDDNAIRHPISKKKEPMSRRELEQRFLTIQSQRDELKQKLKDNQSQLVHIQQEHQKVVILYDQEKVHSIQLLNQYQEKQQQLNTVIVEVENWKNRADKNNKFFLEEQEKYQTTLALYNEEKNKTNELLMKYEEANQQKENYIKLYHEAQADLKLERRSKAGIKGWSTRRKKENEQLKQEIGKMTQLLKESLERKDQAINNLYIVAERMERIQNLVDSVDNESSHTPVVLLDKLKKIWLAIREILAE